MITHKWINTQELTKGITVYYDLLRMYCKFMAIEILRNEFDANSGLYLVCPRDHINDVTRVITQTITIIEKKTELKKFKKGKEHVSEQRSKYKGKLIKRIIKASEEGAPEWTTQDLQDIAENKKLQREYIQEIPALKILKPFRAKS